MFGFRMVVDVFREIKISNGDASFILLKVHREDKNIQKVHLKIYLLRPNGVVVVDV